MDSSFDCPICFVEFDDGAQKPRLPQCGHAICSNCLATLLKSPQSNSKQCPTCKQPFTETNVENYPVPYNLIPSEKNSAANESYQDPNQIQERNKTLVIGCCPSNLNLEMVKHSLLDQLFANSKHGLLQKIQTYKDHAQPESELGERVLEVEFAEQWNKGIADQAMRQRENPILYRQDRTDPAQVYAVLHVSSQKLTDDYWKTLGTRVLNKFSKHQQSNLSGHFQFDFDFVMVQLSVPLERDPEIDLVRIDDIPKELQPLSETYSLEERLMGIAEIGSPVVVVRCQQRGSFFWVIFAPKKRHLVVRELLDHGVLVRLPPPWGVRNFSLRMEDTRLIST